MGIPFAFEINPELSDAQMLSELATMTDNIKDRHFRVDLLLMKLIKHEQVEIDYENLDNGFRHFNGCERAFLGLCFEKTRLMLNGRFICLNCAQSFAERTALKCHIKVCNLFFLKFLLKFYLFSQNTNTNWIVMLF